uniref:Cytospin-A n=1 Tax=Syphacia muris TaxID=451379 RepID=A0A0N5ABU7_9BILA
MYNHFLENPPSPAPHSKLPVNNRPATLRQPTSKLQLPSSIRNSGLNNNVMLRLPSRSSATTSSGTYSSIPAITPVSKLSNISSTNSNMLKIKFFAGNKDKLKKNVSSVPQSRNVKIDEKLSSSVSKLIKPKTSSLKAPKQLSSQNANASMKVSALQQKDALKSAKAKPVNLDFLTDGVARSKLAISGQKRFSKNCNDISPQELFSNSSHTSSAESSSLSMNSTSSKTSSLNCSETKSTVFNPKSLNSKISTAATPPTSPSESKPMLAVKGISATKAPLEASSDKQGVSASAEDVQCHQIKTGDFISTEVASEDENEIQSETSQLPPTSVLTPTSLKLISIQSPAVGVVSPMPSHRNSRAVSPHASKFFCFICLFVYHKHRLLFYLLDFCSGAGNQSDASTTSGSRDSDNVSVIYNPIADKKQMSSGGLNEVESSKAP